MQFERLNHITTYRKKKQYISHSSRKTWLKCFPYFTCIFFFNFNLKLKWFAVHLLVAVFNLYTICMMLSASYCWNTLNAAIMNVFKKNSIYFYNYYAACIYASVIVTRKIELIYTLMMQQLKFQKNLKWLHSE